MNDGKLVRDLIPHLIRKSGRNPQVRHLKDEELSNALSLKLCEEADEVSGALNDPDKLIEELADVTEVIAALMAVLGISERQVAEARDAKAQQRGRFDQGTWLISAVPAWVRRFRSADVDAQRVNWIPDRWTAAFAGHEVAHAKLTEHSHQAGGIARSFIHAQSDGDPVDLFLMAMAWGYRPRDYGPRRTQNIVAHAGAADSIAAIVDATRTRGAAAGWGALLRTHKISGLNMSFGTKLLYFAGYTTAHRPRPLILDERVRVALQELAPGTVPARGLVREADYMNYLDLAERWAIDPLWQHNPDTVEYALFAKEGP